ncbi:MAG TPA: GNAT family N-acetyltransferase [Anaerolineae bacterium]|jgi:ribosomal protein S18 acetylase RimI-like enzyme|nr:GNAT family N-acetyltransferase [Anaerolineae bacterium]
MVDYKPESRPVRADDYWPIHRLIGETTSISPLGFNGDIRRWEGKRFYDKNPAGNPDWYRNSQLWLRPSGQPVAVAHPDSPGYPALLVHPDYRRLEPQMIAWAEKHLSKPLEDGRRQIQFYVYDYDVYRQQLMEDRGYEKTPSGGTIRRLHFRQQQLVRPALAKGYLLRTTHPEDDADAQQLADLLNAAFNRDFHNAVEYQNFTRQAPSFQPDLDLVTIAPDGAFAAYVGIPYDSANRLGIFEPVCTHPEHRRQGLARTLMQDGLRRLQALGAHYAMVDTGDMIPANRLYDTLGFGEIRQGYYWRKIF